MAPTRRVAIIQWHIKVRIVYHHAQRHISGCTIDADQDIRSWPSKRTTPRHANTFAKHQPKVQNLPSSQSTTIHVSNQSQEPSANPCRYHLSAWAPSDPRWATQAGDSAKYLANYQALAKELQICLVPGTIIEKVPGPDGTVLFYNTAFFISNNGTVLGSYRKKNIWHPERPHLTSSGLERHAAIDTPIGRVGMLICWDLAFPEAFRELIADRAEIVILPTFCELSPVTSSVQ